MNVPDKDYSTNTSCALNLISTFSKEYRKDQEIVFLFLMRFPTLGLYLMFGLCRISVYSRFGLDRFHCTCIVIREWSVLIKNKNTISGSFLYSFENVDIKFSAHDVFVE
jgi:hypothetical protein